MEKNKKNKNKSSAAKDDVEMVTDYAMPNVNVNQSEIKRTTSTGHQACRCL